MKSILVIDTPKSCAECRLLDESNWYCIGYHEACDLKGISNRPSWCPLKPMPDKTDINDWLIYNEAEYVAIGWNACLDELEGKDDRT